MATFTIIFEYRGGTYIRQVTADNPQAALLAWSEVLNVGEIQGLGPQRLARLAREVAENAGAPVPISGLTNAWCAGPLCDGLVHIVKTDVTP